jgi:hypothetical protein
MNEVHRHPKQPSAPERRLHVPVVVNRLHRQTSDLLAIFHWHHFIFTSLFPKKIYPLIHFTFEKTIDLVYAISFGSCVLHLY